MKNVGLVIGSASQAVELVVSMNIVYVHTDIQPYVDEEGNVVEGMYQYNEVQYTKDEYIHMMADENKKLLGDVDRLSTLAVIQNGGA